MELPVSLEERVTVSDPARRVLPTARQEDLDGLVGVIGEFLKEVPNGTCEVGWSSGEEQIHLSLYVPEDEERLADERRKVAGEPLLEWAFRKRAVALGFFPHFRQQVGPVASSREGTATGQPARQRKWATQTTIEDFL
jgi:hypothetical protein